MAETIPLRRTPDWEKARSSWATFEHFFYNSNHEVTKVKGKIAVLVVRCVAGNRSTTVDIRNVHWNEEGQCFVGTHNVRNRKYDIRFDR